MTLAKIPGHSSSTVRGKQQVSIEAGVNVNYWLAFRRWVVRGDRFRREYVTIRGQMYLPPVDLSGFPLR